LSLEAIDDLLGKRIGKTESPIVTLRTILLLRQSDLYKAVCPHG